MEFRIHLGSIGLCAALVFPACGLAEQGSLESILERRLDAVAVGAAADPTIQSKVAAFTRQPATGISCDLADPDVNANLATRAQWNRNAAHCARGLAKAARMEAARSVGDEAVKLSLFAEQLEAETEAAESQAAERDAENRFLGYEWGVGFGASHSFDQIINDAVVVNGVIRANKEQTIEPRALLEFHRLLWGHDNGKAGGRIKTAWGPFFAVAAKPNDVIGGFGMGLMRGWKDSDAPADSAAFTVGLGIMLDADVKTLAKGFEEDKPLPAGETAIRYHEKSRASAILIVTRTF